MNITRIHETDFAKNGTRSIWRIFAREETARMAFRLYTKKWPELNYAIYWQDVAGIGLHLSQVAAAGQYGDAWRKMAERVEEGTYRHPSYYLRRHKRKQRRRQGLNWKKFFAQWGTEGWRLILESGKDTESKKWVLSDLVYLVEQEAKKVKQ